MDWSTDHAVPRKWGEPLNSRTQEEEVRTLCTCPSKGHCTPPLSLSCTSKTHEVRRIPTTYSCHGVLPLHPKAESNEVNKLWAESSKIMSQIKSLFLISCLYQVFCHSEGKVTRLIVNVYLHALIKLKNIYKMSS